MNCCSVNGPRGYGSISQWGVMRTGKGLVLNYYGPMTAAVPSVVIFLNASRRDVVVAGRQAGVNGYIPSRALAEAF